MGVEHLSAVLHQSPERNSRLLVMIIIATYADQRGEWTVDLEWLERLSRLNKRRVQGILAELLQAGELAQVPAPGRAAYRVLTGQRAETCAPRLSNNRGNKHPLAQGLAPAQEIAPASTVFEVAAAQEIAPFPPLAPSFPLHSQSPPNPPESPSPPSLDLQSGGSRTDGAAGARPLSGPQLAVATVTEQLRTANVPIPAPGQIGLWAATIGLEPLVELVAALIARDLAGKQRPEAYIHAAVMDRAGKKPAGRPAGRPLSATAAAGADATRREQARRLAAAAAQTEEA